jgi:hypothetical protein
MILFFMAAIQTSNPLLTFILININSARLAFGTTILVLFSCCMNHNKNGGGEI